MTEIHNQLTVHGSKNAVRTFVRENRSGHFKKGDSAPLSWDALVPLTEENVVLMWGELGGVNAPVFATDDWLYGKEDGRTTATIEFTTSQGVPHFWLNEAIAHYEAAGLTFELDFLSLDNGDGGLVSNKGYPHAVLLRSEDIDFSGDVEKLIEQTLWLDGLTITEIPYGVFMLNHLWVALIREAEVVASHPDIAAEILRIMELTAQLNELETLFDDDIPIQKHPSKKRRQRDAKAAR